MAAPDFPEAVEASWLHVVPLSNGLLRLRIEDIEYNALTKWIDLTQEERVRATFLLVDGPKETMNISGGREEYRIRVNNEEALKTRLYPNVDE